MHISSQKLMYEVSLCKLRFLVFLFVSVLCSCLCMYKICSYKAQSLPKRIYSNLKEKPGPDWAKTPHEYTPPHVCVTIRGVTGHKIHGSVLYDTVVSQFGTFPIWGVGQLVTSQCWKCFKPWRRANGYHTSTHLQTKCKIHAGDHLNQSFHYKQKVKV